jgi:poly-gamma-glutamate synthesis protein (capsule biosynthesis protein)
MNAILMILLFTFGVLFPSAPKVEIVFAGDAMQHQAQLDAAVRRDGSYDYSDCFKALKPYISEADYAVVNLETPIGTGNYTGYPCFNAPPSYVDALADAGFDLFLTANNHTLDRRDAGLVKTIDALDKRLLAHLGTYRNRAERDSVLPMLKSIGGIDVAFLNYTYGTNGIPVQGKVVVDYIDTDRMKSDIQRARNAGAEIVTVCIHWGVEYQLLPTQTQKSIADKLVDAGVDVIIGGHPHVIQPMEMRRNSEGRNVLLVYSLGNFISNMKTRDTRGGAIVKVTLERDHDGKACVSDANYSLVFTEPAEGGRNFRVVPVEDCTMVQCGEFVKSAMEIFTKYNKGVKRVSAK